MSRGTLDPARCFKISSTGLSPSTAGFPKTIRLSLSNANCSPQPRRTRSFGLASFPFARRYLGNRVFFLLLLLLRCFSSQRSLHTLWIHVWILEVCSSRFPHSDISGSMAVCASPKLFAAYHVFHRLLVPRHSPCALSCLTSHNTSYCFFQKI